MCKKKRRSLVSEAVEVRSCASLYSGPLKCPSGEGELAGWVLSSQSPLEMYVAERRGCSCCGIAVARASDNPFPLDNVRGAAGNELSLWLTCFVTV